MALATPFFALHYPYAFQIPKAVMLDVIEEVLDEKGGQTRVCLVSASNTTEYFGRPYRMPN